MECDQNWLHAGHFLGEQRWRTKSTMEVKVNIWEGQRNRFFCSTFSLAEHPPLSLKASRPQPGKLTRKGTLEHLHLQARHPPGEPRWRIKSLKVKVELWRESKTKAFSLVAYPPPFICRQRFSQESLWGGERVWKPWSIWSDPRDRIKRWGLQVKKAVQTSTSSNVCIW